MKLEREELGVEDEEEDMEIIVNRVDHRYIPEAVTLELLRHYTKKDEMLAGIMEDFSRGKLRDKYQKSSYKVLFEELSCVQGILMRGTEL